MQGERYLWTADPRRVPTRPPVTSHQRRLPLKDLEWERFEDFCCDLFRRLGSVIDCQRYGKGGDTQSGIDLIAQCENGTRWAIQCKQYEKFTVKDAEKAVKAAIYPADRYFLLISTEATTKVRDVIAKRAHWTLWDVLDISREVRALPAHHSRSLVTSYFGPHWLKEFLGVPELECFRHPEDYFKNELNPLRRVHQAWALVGRTDLLGSLDTFLTGEYRAGLLIGPGGVGKTKLLYEWSRRRIQHAPEVQPFFVDKGVSLSRDVGHELPLGPCILIVDDAHAARDLETILTLAKQRQAPTQVLLSCRPHAVRQLRSRLRETGFDPREILELKLPTLSRKEMVELARQSLASEQHRFAEILAAVAHDSPLLTVVGARLVSEHRISPTLLERHEEFQEVLFDRFQEIILGEVASQLEPRRCVALLQILSALSPFDVENEFLQQESQKFLAMEADEFSLALEALVEAGALLRRQSYLSVTPDLLAEHVLYRACITPAGRSNGLAERLFDRFAGLHPEPLMHNLAALSRRLRETGKGPQDLLASSWERVRKILREGSNRDRLYTFKLVIAAAYHEPLHALDAVRTALNALHDQRREPAKAQEVHDVQERAFEALWRILLVTREASDFEWYMTRSLNLLWEAGRDDARQMEWGRADEHGMGLLHRLARFMPDRPIRHYELILDEIDRWLSAPDAFAHVHVPLLPLEALLKKQVNVFTNLEKRFQMHSAVADVAQLGPIRQHALDLIYRCVRSPEPRFVCQGLESLRRVLCPLSTDDRHQEEPDPWIPEQAGILRFLEQWRTEAQEPVFQQYVAETLCLPVSEGLSTTLLPQVLRILESIPDSFPLRLTRVLTLDLSDPRGVRRAPPPAFRERWPAASNLEFPVVQELIERYPEPEAGAALLNERFALLARCKIHAFPERFLRRLARTSPAYSQHLCQQILADPSMPLAGHVPILLAGLREEDGPHGRAVMREFVATGDVRRHRDVIWGYGNITVDVEGKPERAPLLESEDVELLLSVDVSSHADSASTLCYVLSVALDHGELSPSQLPPFLLKLVPIQNLVAGSIPRFLKSASEHLPDQVFELLLARIRLVGEGVSQVEHPFPRDGKKRRYLDRLSESPRVSRYLSAVFETLHSAAVPQRQWLALLFNQLSSGSRSSMSLGLLEDQAREGDALALATVASILSHAPQDFVITHFELTCRLVERALALGETSYRELEQALLQRTILGIGEGDFMGKSPDGVQLEKQARACLEKLPLGAPASRFYEELLERIPSRPPA